MDFAKSFTALRDDSSGFSAVEYGLIVSLIAIATSSSLSLRHFILPGSTLGLPG